ncbi:unnamed protein product [Phyllotreta striolata]|uniref:Uncharacterized protein n=1 Tax=Phyllotreta striolata TaxID=444603 RepID=A0A9N9XKM8_PHYSR|nr:unnamed protein product [Phyllotreta striolata]
MHQEYSTTTEESSGGEAFSSCNDLDDEQNFLMQYLYQQEADAAAEEEHLEEAARGRAATIRFRPSSVESDVEKTPSACEFFTNELDFSHKFVDKVLKSAKRFYERKSKKRLEKGPAKPQVADIAWPTIGEFDERAGHDKILEYIAETMLTKETWATDVRLRSIASDCLSEFYSYEARFSISTPCYPIPQATASVFFEFEVCRAKPPDCTVDVAFRLEDFRLAMAPGKDLISDALLFRVIDMKLAVFKKFRF